MSSSSDTPIKEMVVETLFEGSVQSSEDPPMAEWSSFILPEDMVNPKKALHAQGLYDPGSGEICEKYVAMSCSSVLRHVYYNYPANKDPGIMDALLKPEPKKFYPLDGQELYLDICKDMKMAPVRPFHRGLLTKEINLRYYGVNPNNVRAMCLALENNMTVRRLDLTSNFLSMDACYHLGQLLRQNYNLTELILSGCNIGPPGLRRVVDRLADRTMEELDVSKNRLEDDGFKYITDKIMERAIIKKLNVSHNALTGAAALLLSDALLYNNTLTDLNMSWNQMGTTFEQTGPNSLLQNLGDSAVLKSLDLSWNALTTTTALRKLLSGNTLDNLILKNNRFDSNSVRIIANMLPSCTNLRTLDISHNKLVPADAFFFLSKLRDPRVQLQNLYMEDEPVNKDFLYHLEQIKKLPYRENMVIKYGRVMRNYTLSTADLREIVMRRLAFVTKPTKKNRFDIQLFLLRLHKKKRNIEPRELLDKLKVAGAPPFGDALIVQCAEHFPGPVTEKGIGTINMDIMVDYVRRLWPDKKLPPTPPPEPKIEVPEPEKEKKVKQDKAKKKKKN